MSYSYDDIYPMYAWRDNRRRLVLTQGEGYSGTLSGTYMVKAPRFQLMDEQGIIEIPSSGSPRIQLAVTRPNRTEDLLSCNIEDREQGIISCPITKSMTDIAGEVKGEIRLILDNTVIKFYGIDFFVYDGVSDEAAAQSSQFSDLIQALQQVSAIIEGGSSGTISLDTVIQHGGTNPAASGIIYDFVNGNYIRYKGVADSEVNTANDSQTIYRHTIGGNFKGLVFFTGYNNYVGATTVRQYRLCMNGRFEYRNGTIVTPANTPNTYTWDKAYNEDWNPIGSTQNIQDGAVTDDKLANKKWNFVNLGQVTSNQVFDSYVDPETIYVVKVAAVKCMFFIIDNIQVRYIHTVGWQKREKTNDTWGDWQGTIYEQSIHDGAVTEDKLAGNSVTASKIKDGEITPSKLDRQYEKVISCSGNEIDTANDSQAIYIHHVNGGFKGIVFFAGYNNYAGVTTVKQFRLCKDGKFEYRTGTVVTPTTTPNTYTWDKTYDENWNPIGSTQNLQDGAVTLDKLSSNVKELITSSKTAIDNKIVVFSYTLSRNAWNNNQQTISVPNGYIVNGDIIADTDFSSLVYNQLCADGCCGIYIDSVTNGNVLTLTAHALGNTPTADIDIQVTLTAITNLDD